MAEVGADIGIDVRHFRICNGTMDRLTSQAARLRLIHGPGVLSSMTYGVRFVKKVLEGAKVYCVFLGNSRQFQAILGNSRQVSGGGYVE